MNSAIDIDARIADADSEFPALFQLFGGYFHEDWRVEHENPSAALTAFLEEAPPEAVREAAAELARVLDLPVDDAALGALLREGFGCAYVPAHDGFTNEGWLASVRERLQPGG